MKFMKESEAIKEKIKELGFINRYQNYEFESLDMLLLQCPGWRIETPPLSLGVLASYGKSKGFKVLGLDLNVEMYRKKIDEYKDVWNIEVSSWFWNSKYHVRSYVDAHMFYLKSFFELIDLIKPKSVGFSIYNSSFDFSLSLSEKIKEVSPSTKIIFGDPHVSYSLAGKYTLEISKCIDVVVESEGEYTLGEVLKAVSKGEELTGINGTFYKVGEEIVVEKSHEPIRELDDLHYTDFSNYIFENYTKPERLPLISSRGCPNKCIYCTEMVFWKTDRSFSAERVFKEIEYQFSKHNQITYVDFQDSLINGNLRHLERFADLVIESGMKFKWASQAVIRREMDYKFFLKLKKSGCHCLAFGMETTSLDLMSLAGKNLARMTDLDKFVRESSEAGLHNAYNFMFVLPRETEEHHIETLEFIKRNANYYIGAVNRSPAFCGFSNGTAGGDNPEDYGMIRDESRNNYWVSEDGTNIYLVRLRRFEEFCALVNELGINTTYPSPMLLNREKALGDYYNFQGDYTQALGYLKMWLKKNPSDKQSKEKLMNCLAHIA